jgi:hypothetical protein
VNPVSTPDVPGAELQRGGRPWLLISSSVVALACALVPALGLRGLRAPAWLAVLAAALVFPILPVVWHVVAEWRGRSAGPLDRLAVRCLALGLVVLAVAFSTLGPREVGRRLAALVGYPRARPAVPRGTPQGPAPARSRERELDALIPADATLVVALSDSALLQPLLASSGMDASSKLAALDKCQIGVQGARMVVATRGDAPTRLVAVRATGVTDPRNLYCLVGVLGNDRLKLRFTSDKAPVKFEVEGLLARTLKFEAVDGETVVAVEGGWQDGAMKKLFAADASHGEGPLAAPLERVDRGASLWSASVTDGAGGRWDLALDAHVDGTTYKLRGSSVPPSGEDNRAEIEARVPLAFASALPAAALKQGIGGVVAAVAATGHTVAAPPPAHP